MICQKKNKRLLVFCLSFLLFCLAVIPCLFSVQSYASETNTESVESYFRTHNFYDTCAYVCRKYASFPYLDYMTGSSSGITYDAWADWLETKGLGNLLDENVTTTGSGGGRGYDIPQDVRQQMLNFVQETYIQENPLTYTECYIPSYKNLDTSWIGNYSTYNNIKVAIKNSGGYGLLCAGGNVNYNNYCYLITIPKQTFEINFYGSTENGSFTSVQLEHNWSNLQSIPIGSYGIKLYQFRPNSDDFTECNSWSETNARREITCTGVKNNTSYSQASGYTSSYTIFTNLDSNELVYVFSTLNALKAFTGGVQPYYFPSNSQSTVPYYDGFTQSDLNAAGNFYNNIVVNTSGDNPNDTKKKTDSILGSLDGIIGGSDSESSGGLFDSLGDIITGATGAISPIKEIVLGDIKDLVADVFDFLPPTIITLWLSGIIFGIFFGVLKLIRG